MDKRGRRLHSTGKWMALAITVAFGLNGCSPAVQPPNETDNQPGKPVDTGFAWQTVLDAAQKGETTGRYMIKMSVDVSESSMHSTLSVYGGIDPPNRCSVNIAEDNNDVEFYQQGEVAYYQDNGRWSETTPMSSLDVFPSYIRVIQQASSQQAPVEQLADAYVNDEFCSVYRTAVAASALSTLPILGGKVDPKNLREVRYTFYVGRKDQMLREVKTQSVGALNDTGPIQVNSDTILFDLGNPVANVQLPKDLVHQLENSGT